MITKHVFVFRVDPVPSTGKRHLWYRSRIYKKPKLTQEYKLSFACHKSYIRDHRKNLYRQWNDYWNDYCYFRSDFKNKRSWKKNKKNKQWM